jgi:mannose-1-phosphate guanylyltransferase
MTQVLTPIILAGGKGERFWPLSRQHRPKQFLSLDGSGQTLLQVTADRLLPLAGGWQDLWVITAAHLAAGVQEQLPQLPPENILVEPQGRDTAPAVAWATLEVAKRSGPETVVGFFPADHWIGDLEQFQATLKAAARLAVQQSAIVTLGIRPLYAATGYGYIQQAAEGIPIANEFTAYKVQRFTEKPDQATAEAFLASGAFSWNSGMFIFRASVALADLQRHAPEIYEPLQAAGVAAYPQVPKKSIDYALMEKTQQAYVLPVSFHWDDLGDWNSLARLRPAKDSNVELANHLGLDTRDTIFYSNDPEDLVVTIGLADLVVVRDGKITLIMHKQRTQDIKKVLEQVRSHPQYRELL